MIDPFDMNYALIAIKANGDLESMETLEVLHTCMYENEPSEIDKQELIKELSSSEEFNMVGQIEGKDYFILLMQGEELDAIKEMLGIDDEDDEDDE